MAQNPFIGTWRLVSFEYIDSEGQTSYPFGHDFAGYLMYDECPWLLWGQIAPILLLQKGLKKEIQTRKSQLLSVISPIVESMRFGEAKSFITPKSIYSLMQLVRTKSAHINLTITG